MNQFIPASDLNKSFAVYGHFYCNDMGNDGKFPCRSVLEIASLNEKVKIQELSNSKADAIVIMMNPGSSYPVGLDPCIAYNKKTIGKLVPFLVDTKPDPTQYQIMRIMACKDWKHVRVINLSDLRTPKSCELYKVLKSIDNDQHSVFAKARKKELKLMLNRKDKAPIICAWGIDNKLIPLTKKAIQALKGNTLIGAKDESKDRFLHASPQNHTQRLKWLTEILKQLQ